MYGNKVHIQTFHHIKRILTAEGEMHARYFKERYLSSHKHMYVADIWCCYLLIKKHTPVTY
jgi:hypothetical protein